MAKDVSTKQDAVRYETWVNPETGETRVFTVVDRPYKGDFNFHKVWLEDLAKVLGLLGGAKIAAFNAILEFISPYDNKVSFTYQEIMDKANISNKSVSETVKTLVEADFMRKVRPSVYQVNPKMLIRGSHDKRMGLLLKYDDLNDGRQLSIDDPADRKW